MNTVTTNLATLIGASCRENSERIALVDAQCSLTYRELEERIVSAAADLVRRGVKPNDPVALLMLNGVDYSVAYFAVQTVGGIAVLVNARLAAPEIEHVLEDSGARILVTESQLLDRVPSRIASSVVTVAELRGSPTRDGYIGDWAGAERTAGDVANILYTSGTTGRPKGAMQTHANLLANCETSRREFVIGAEDTALVVAPLFHATAINSQLIPFVASGATCVLVPAFDRSTAIATLRDHRVTVFAGVAAMVELLALDDAFVEATVPDLRAVILGGSPVGPSTLDVLRRRFPSVGVANVWGMTEATSIVTVGHRDDLFERPWTAGKVVDGTDLRVLVDGEFVVDPDVVGELVVRGPNVTAGYWKNPAATAETFVNGWLHTGDIGRIDPEGFVEVLDRLKDMIIRGGENVYSVEVEAVLVAHPGVAEVAVVGVPDSVFGERVCAVVARAAGSNVSAAQLREYASRDLADYKVPDEVRFVEALPRNASGKVLKRRIGEAIPAGT